MLILLSILACNGDDAPNADSGTEPIDSDPVIDTGCDDPVVYNIDADGDGFGSTNYQQESCGDVPDGYVLDGTDCDDLDALVNPDGVEECNGIDDDCDGTADEDLELSTFYADADGDGYGDPDSTTELCAISDGWVEDWSDCDDADGAVSPAAEEVCGDGIDNDCDTTANSCGLADELLATEARTIYQGEAAGDQFGSPIRMVGDLDANALDELAIGARGSDLGADGAGAIYLFQTPLNGGTRSASEAKAVITGEAEGDQAFAAFGLGDSNGDGKGDLIIGAKKNDDGGSDAGKVYFMAGPFSGQSSLADAGASWSGVGAGDQAGTLSVGDLNGDGELDVLVAAQKNDNGGSDAGAVFVLNGPFGAWLGHQGLYAADAFLKGSPGEQAGGGLSFAGDINGDGIGDALIGAPYQNLNGSEDAGAVYLLHGPVSGTSNLADSNDVHFVASGGDEAGWGLAAAGDVDGDGVDDFLVNAQRADIREDNANEGAIYVVTADWSGSTDKVDLDDTWMKIQGQNTDDKLASVNGGGDLNGDGHIDLVVGTRFHDAGGEDAGAAWVLYGPLTGGTVDVEDLAHTRVDGKGAGDGLAAPAGLIGDPSGDGYDELAIGARWNDDADEDAGAAYIFRGSGL